ncbi:MAG TPA: hypothetical protein DFR83_28190 [Deltaproteobacteria bacterium]|nr:hypothetical protein [Deltaproteobacteria bacterium]
MSHRRRSAALLACAVSITGCTPAVYKLEERFTGAVNGTPFASAPSSTTAPLTDLDPASYPLIEAVPALRGALQVVPLCDCPTPIQRLEHVASETGTTDAPVEVYAKQDGASNHAIYGGNKIRKLELLMAQALAAGKSEVVISGSVGSHSVVATALVAKHLGLTPQVHLVPQQPSERVTQNLLVLARILALSLGEDPQLGDQPVGSLTYHPKSSEAVRDVLSTTVRAAFTADDTPFLCPTGATSPLTTLAYINAMHELARDVDAGRLPAVPSRIYVPAGSGGTFIGLLIGARTIDRFKHTQIVPVTSGSGRPTEQYHAHLEAVLAYLHTLTDGDFPAPEISLDALDAMLDRDFSGAYGEITPAGVEAQSLAAQDGLHLEHTYTAKTMARLLHDLRQPDRSLSEEPEVWLYWNTHHATGDRYAQLAEPPVGPRDLALLQQVFTAAELHTYGLQP